MDYSDQTLFARETLELAQKKFGTTQVWDQIDWVEIEVCNLTGFLMTLKGATKTFLTPTKAKIYLHRQRVEFSFNSNKNLIAVYEKGGVQLFDSPSNLNFSSDENYRLKFLGLNKNRRWSQLDATYFFGYALTSYFHFPFCLSQGQVLSCKKIKEEKQELTKIKIKLPSHWHTHSPIQHFYFDSSGLLVRNDYCGEIIGPWAHAAHYISSYHQFQGLMIPTQRRVFPNFFGQSIKTFSILSANLNVIEVKSNTSTN